MAVKPVGKRILVKPIEKENKTESGILLVTEQKSETRTATVVEVGEADPVASIAVGQVVLYERHSGISAGEGNLILETREVIAVVEE